MYELVLRDQIGLNIQPSHLPKRKGCTRYPRPPHESTCGTACGKKDFENSLTRRIRRSQVRRSSLTRPSCPVTRKLVRVEVRPQVNKNDVSLGLSTTPGPRESGFPAPGGAVD